MGVSVILTINDPCMLPEKLLFLLTQHLELCTHTLRILMLRSLQFQKFLRLLKQLTDNHILQLMLYEELQSTLEVYDVLNF